MTSDFETPNPLPRRVKPVILAVVLTGGACALAWQLLWQIEIALSIGASVQATAITVAVAMAGMAAGALAMPRPMERWLKRFNPLILLGAIEVVIAFAAGIPIWCSSYLREVDTWVFQKVPAFAGGVQLLMLAMALGPSTFLMGATVPLFGRLAEMLALREGRGFSLSRLYALNIFGAVMMVGLAAFVFLPVFGRAGTAAVIGALHLLAGLVALGGGWKVDGRTPDSGTREREEDAPPGRRALVLAFASGAAILALEVVWFRLLRIAWLSTSDAFAIMLMVFLLSLFLGARLSVVTKARSDPALFLFAGAVLALLATPLLERFDGWSASGGAYGIRILGRVFLAAVVMGPPVVLMGVCLPALLDRAKGIRSWGRLYALNTLGAVLGSLGAAWLLFPLIGPVASSWAVAGTAALVSVAVFRKERTQNGRVRGFPPAAAVAILLTAVAIAIWFATGVGTSRVPGPTALLRGEHAVIAHRDAADASTSVVAIRGGADAGETYRLLFIDGYAASGEFGPFTRYMVEMGRLPMVIHPAPERALVICYGTGQTANAVRNHGAAQIDIVDINPAVFELSPWFPGNENVLEDPRVTATVMDGRAWLRRSEGKLDVVTLEPMPPFFAGSNALYSVEFYEEVRSRLNRGGVVAQWFPMHLLSTDHARAVAASFADVFPASILWIDPVNRDEGGAPQQGILIGYEGTPGELESLVGERFPLEVALDGEGLKRFVHGAGRVTDDNQLLAYGKDGLHRFDLSRRHVAAETYRAILESAAAGN